MPVLSLEGPAEPPEGAPLALRCISHPSSLWPLASLQYLFYRDEAVVGGPQGSPELCLPAVGLTHSGNYSCEVQTETATVRKRSTPLTVRVYSECAGGMGMYPGPAAPQVPASLPGVPPSLPRSPHPCLGPRIPPQLLPSLLGLHIPP